MFEEKRAVLMAQVEERYNMLHSVLETLKEMRAQPGPPGPVGPQGIPGRDGRDGLTGPQGLNGSKGERGSFRCIIEGASEVTWTKVGGDINSQTTIIRGTELFFNNAAVEDRGVYVCGKLIFS